MGSRQLLAGVLLAGAIAGLGAAFPVDAEIVVTDNGIAVKQTDQATPTRGMSMDQVIAKFGAPVTKDPPVGKPPITRWEYPGFVVFFEYQHVIHTVIAAPQDESRT